MFETIRIQAEAAVRGHISNATSGPIVRTPGQPPTAEAFSEGAYLDFTDPTQTNTAGNAGEYFEITVNVDEAGPYEFDFRYALATGASRPLDLFVNDLSTRVRALDFPSTTTRTATQRGFSDWVVKSETIVLQAGENKVRLATNGVNGANFD